MIWAGISLNGRTALVVNVVPGNLNGRRYIDENLLTSCSTISPSDGPECHLSGRQDEAPSY